MLLSEDYNVHAFINCFACYSYTKLGVTLALDLHSATMSNITGCMVYRTKSMSLYPFFLATETFAE